MVYFDGGEDVDRRRFNYYASKFQATAMAKFRKRPVVHMGTVLTHNLWHSFTRSGTFDTYFNTIRGRIVAGGTWDKLPTVRDHIDRSVQRRIRLKGDLLPAELGWFGIWPKGEGTDGLQLDEIEYLTVTKGERWAGTDRQVGPHRLRRTTSRPAPLAAPPCPQRPTTAGSKSPSDPHGPRCCYETPTQPPRRIYSKTHAWSFANLRRCGCRPSDSNDPRAR